MDDLVGKKGLVLYKSRPALVKEVSGDRLEVDHPDALAVRDGVALFAGPGGVPVVFDHEGVSQVVGDLAGRESP